MKSDEFVELARGIYLEGLALDHERDVAWYSDVIAGGIHGVTFDGKRLASFNQDRMWTGGVLMNADGAVLSTGQHGIVWNNPETGRMGWLLRELEGRPINGINEMWPDGTGGIFFGTNDIERVVEGKDTRPTELWRLAADGELTKLAEGIGFTNGIAFDAERFTLYCNDTFHRTWAFDVAADLTLSNKRPFFEKEDVDGMSLDAEGTVWITGFRSNYLTRVAPDGTELPCIHTPDGSITQVRFGGPEGLDYFFNVVPADGGDTLKDGGDITQTNSRLYRGRADRPGMKIAPARFKLT